MIDDQLWNDILNRSLEERAVDMIMAAEVPLNFNDGGVPRLLERLSWRGGQSGIAAMETLYLLSMVSFTGREFSYHPHPKVNFLAVCRGAFVVAAAGPILRDSGRGLRDAIDKALAELAAAAGPEG